MMIGTGLVSVTFRELPPEAIVELVAQAGLQGIEWGGDIHAPHGNLRRADEVAGMTKDAGLAIAAYGSYYFAGEPENTGFSAVLDTALALGAPTIRIWAGRKSSNEATEDYRRRVTDDCREISALAGRAGMAVACEYHGGTLTDTCESAVRLMRDCPDLKCYWQPRVGAGEEESAGEIAALSPWLANIHVFRWNGLDRQPLAQGAEPWERYFGLISGVPGDRFAMLEFVKGDAPEQFLEDAGILRRMLGR